MEEDNRTNKELILAVLSKCKQALPELAILTQRLEKGAGPSPKVKKKDCLNPTFLIRLSECGENIRLILQHALSLDFPSKDSLKRHYNEYMQVIYDIRKYHEQAHLAHDMHKNSTAMKGNLLAELQEQTRLRKALEAKLAALLEEQARLSPRQGRRSQEVDEKDSINLSHISQISQISKKHKEFGQLYGGDERIGKLEPEPESAELARLRKKISELQGQLQAQKKAHEQELDYHKQGILQLQSKFEQLMKTNGFQSGQKTLSNQQAESRLDQFYRLLIIQATTVEQFLQEQAN